MHEDKGAAAVAAMMKTAEEHGGVYEEPEAYRDACARTLFDRPNAEDGTVAVLIPRARMADVPLGALVRIDSFDARTRTVEARYVGTVVSGPFAEPDAMHPDAPTLKIAAANGAVLTPKYHGFARVQLFGVEVEGALAPPTRRPCPNSPVFLLGRERVEEVLGLAVDPGEAPVRIGRLEGAHDLAVTVPARKKSVLPKHLAVLGTTGGGKSTTVAGLLTGLAEAGNAVVIFDTEGEYTTLHEATDSKVMRASLAARGLTPRGVKRSRVYTLAGTKPSNPRHPDSRSFKLAFSELSIHTLIDLLDLPEAQQRRILEAYEVCKVLMEVLRIYPVTPDEQREALEHDEYDAGWAKMTLAMLFDVIEAVLAYVRAPSDRKRSRAKKDDDEDDEAPSRPEFTLRSREFQGHAAELWQVITRRQVEKNEPSWKGILGKLWRLRRADVFSEREAEWIRVEDVLQPGLVSVIDLGDMDAPYLRNLVIAQLLRSIQQCQEARYKAHEAALAAGRDAPLTPVNLFVEEAHEFLSAQRIRQMPNLFDQVARIARRGRKRHLGLVFVTQLPSHLPDEVLGLVNNWVLHKLADANVIARLRRVVPGVDDATWGALPNLAPGQAVCSFTHLTRPLRVSIDPCPCRLRMVE